MSLEKLPQNTSEAIRFAGGLPKMVRNIRDQVDVLSQGLARAADLIFFYELELTKIATAQGFEDINWAKNTAREAIKRGKTL